MQDQYADHNSHLVLWLDGFKFSVQTQGVFCNINWIYDIAALKVRVNFWSVNTVGLFCHFTIYSKVYLCTNVVLETSVMGNLTWLTIWKNLICQVLLFSHDIKVKLCVVLKRFTIMYFLHSCLSDLTVFIIGHNPGGDLPSDVSQWWRRGTLEHRSSGIHQNQIWYNVPTMAFNNLQP